MLILIPLAKAVKAVGLSYRLLSTSVMLTSLTFSIIQKQKRKRENKPLAGRELKE